MTNYKITFVLGILTCDSCDAADAKTQIPTCIRALTVYDRLDEADWHILIMQYPCMTLFDFFA